MGLSPRVRGNPNRSTTGEPVSGSIPACAGEPCAASQSPLAARVYPRVCGGTPDAAIAHGTASGLSPRVRGNRISLAPLLSHVGSIPACAGEPCYWSSVILLWGVYPRVCGGTHHSAPAWLIGTGLSPRVRGNRNQAMPSWPPLGSIPACAGEPPPVRCLGGLGRVYPRVCGGTTLIVLYRACAMGLSPRVRGNL